MDGVRRAVTRDQKGEGACSSVFSVSFVASGDILVGTLWSERVSKRCRAMREIR